MHNHNISAPTGAPVPVVKFKEFFTIYFLMPISWNNVFQIGSPCMKCILRLLMAHMKANNIPIKNSTLISEKEYPFRKVFKKFVCELLPQSPLWQKSSTTHEKISPLGVGILFTRYSFRYGRRRYVSEQSSIIHQSHPPLSHLSQEDFVFICDAMRRLL